MRWTITTVVLALALATGCKKDEPAKGGEAAEAAKDKAGALAGASKAAATKAGVAIGDAKAVAADKAQGAMAAAAPVKVEKVAMSADVVGLGWVPGYDQLFDTVTAKAKKFGVPLPITKAAALEQVKAAAGLKNMDWFATNKPMMVVSFNPKKYSEKGFAILVPVKSADAAKAALPDTKKEGTDGNEFSLDLAGETAYLNFMDGFLVLTAEPKIFAGAKGELAGLAKSYKGNGSFELTASAKNLRTIFADELGAVRQQIKDMKPMLEKELAREMPFPGLGGMDKIIDFYIDMLNTVVDESEQVKIGLNVGDDGNWFLPMSVTAKSGGKIAGLSGKLAKADLSFAAGAPANSWLAFGGHMDPKAFDGMMKYSMDMMGALLKLDDAEKKNLGGMIDELMAIQDGRSWFAFYADGAFPMAISGAAGTSDGAKYEKLFNSYMGLVMGKALTMAKEMLPPQLAGLPTDDFGKLIIALNTLTSAAGVRLESGTSKDGDVSVQRLVVTVDVELLSKVGGPEAAAKAKEITDIFGNKLEFAMAYGPKTIGMAMGPNGVKAATDIAKGTAPRNDNLVKRFPAGTAMFMHVDVNNALTAWKPVVKMVEPGALEAIPSFPAGASAGMTIGAATDTLSMALYGSVDDFVKVGAKAFMDKSASAPSAATVRVMPAEQKEAAPAEQKEAAPVEQKEAAPVEKKEAAPAKEGAKTGLSAGANVVPVK
jgi:hypothetical protein